MRALLAFATLLCLGAASPADPTYRERWTEITTSGKGELSRYDPLERIAGAARPAPFKTARRSRIAPAALAQAEAYAAANNSSAFLVWHDGALVSERYYGGRDASSLIVSKSLAKPLTAIAIGRAIALGKVKSLDQPVADFVTEWRGAPKAAIRVRHLLDMRSGLLAQGFSPKAGDHWSMAYLHPEHDRYIIETYPLTDPPGSIYEYSNATSELVALVIERATGRRYAEFVGTEILKPIGAAGGDVWLNRAGGLAHSGCCALLPARTWLRLALLLLDDGKAGARRLLPKGYVREMRTGTPQNPNYGLGLWLGEPFQPRRGFQNSTRPGPKVLHSEPFAARDLFMFDGNSNQVVYVVPSRRLVVLRTGDSPPKTPEWDNVRLPNLLLRAIR